MNVMKGTSRAFQRGGGHWGQFAPGPQFKGGPQICKIKKEYIIININIFDIKMYEKKFSKPKFYIY
jgi:hypothetical protein